MDLPRPGLQRANLEAGEGWPAEAATVPKGGRKEGLTNPTKLPHHPGTSARLEKAGRAEGGSQGAGAAPSPARPLELGHPGTALCLGLVCICCLIPGTPKPPRPSPTKRLAPSLPPGSENLHPAPHQVRREGLEGGRGPGAEPGGAHRADCVGASAPHVLCLAWSTDSRLAIKDRTAEEK